MRCKPGPVLTIPSIATMFVVVSLAASGCISSRSIIEDLARTPHHPVQGSGRYAALNSSQQDFLYLTEMVRQVHPEPYAAWSRNEFDGEQHRLLHLLAKDTNDAARRCPAGFDTCSIAAETTRIVLERAIEAFLSRLNNSHTNASAEWAGGQLQYPVSFF